MFTDGTKLQGQNFDVDYSTIRTIADADFKSRLRVADNIAGAIKGVNEKILKKREEEETRAGYEAIAGNVIPSFNEMTEKKQKSVIDALINDDNFTNNLKDFVSVQETLAELNPAGGFVPQDFPMETTNQYLVGRKEDDPTTEEDEFEMGKLLQLGFNQDTGDFGYTKTENGIRKFVVVPQEEALRMSESSIKSDTQIMNEALTALREEQGSMIRAKNYVDNRLSTPQGFDNFMTRMRANIKTAFGEELTEEEVKTRLSQGQFQGLIGQFRKEIVGGGVMTEQDAKRIERALGEYGVTSDPEVVRRAIAEVMQRKIQAEKDLIATFESASKANPITFSKSQNLDVSPLDLGDTFTPRGEVIVKLSDGQGTKSLGIRMVGEVIDLGNGQKAKVNEKFELEAIEQ